MFFPKKLLFNFTYEIIILKENFKKLNKKVVTR